MPQITIDIHTQTLCLSHGGNLYVYSISTALKGAGEIEGSEMTPRGLHVITEMIGGELPINAVLRGRQFTGEIYDAALAKAYPDRDWILTRILWLTGQERGVNKGLNAEGVNVDSHQRYIYIHGTPLSEPMGVAQSHGCIRMHNDDLMDLFERVEIGTPINIVENASREIESYNHNE